MHIKAYLPHPMLNPFIAHYVRVEYNSSNILVPEQYYPPLGSVLVIQVDSNYQSQPHKLNSQPLPQYTLMGQWEQSGLWTYPARINSIVITFTPTGFFKLFGLPATKLVNNYESFPMLFQQQIVSNLGEKLQEISETNQQVILLNQFFLQRLQLIKSKLTIADQALNIMQQSHGNLAVELLARRLQVSRRHLFRTFTEQVGISPKVYASMLRFRRAIQLLKANKKYDFQDVIYQCGFYDQSHFIRNFTRFTNQTPSQYLGEEKLVADIMLNLHR